MLLTLKVWCSLSARSFLHRKRFQWVTRQRPREVPFEAITPSRVRWEHAPFRRPDSPRSTIRVSVPAPRGTSANPGADLLATGDGWATAAFRKMAKRARESLARRKNT